MILTIIVILSTRLTSEINISHLDKKSQYSQNKLFHFFFFNLIIICCEEHSSLFTLTKLEYHIQYLEIKLDILI